MDVIIFLNKPTNGYNSNNKFNFKILNDKSNHILNICRIHVGDAYGDIPRGVFVVRGENVVLLGEIGKQNNNYRYLFNYDIITYV